MPAKLTVRKLPALGLVLALLIAGAAPLAGAPGDPMDLAQTHGKVAQTHG
jgi:hypothetical protein